MFEIAGKMGKQKENMREEEELAVEVRKYVCLYHKSSPLYKDKRAKESRFNTRIVDTKELTPSTSLFR